ncbi:MAG: hypothetical protein M1140_07470 [Chloroflexi bacterium]|nr:hypothetical protein [Chloroflexota bacterium]
MTGIYVKLSMSERDALFALSQRERRDERDQAALLIRLELEQLGLIRFEDIPAVIVPLHKDAKRGQHVDA